MRTGVVPAIFISLFLFFSIPTYAAELGAVKVDRSDDGVAITFHVSDGNIHPRLYWWESDELLVLLSGVRMGPDVLVDIESDLVREILATDAWHKRSTVVEISFSPENPPSAVRWRTSSDGYPVLNVRWRQSDLESMPQDVLDAIGALALSDGGTLGSLVDSVFGRSFAVVWEGRDGSQEYMPEVWTELLGKEIPSPHTSLAGWEVLEYLLADQGIAYKFEIADRPVIELSLYGPDRYPGFD
jgi:hypothetical protein